MFFVQNETLWLTQKAMATLFETTPQNTTIHLKNIYETGELEEKATCKEFLHVQQEGNRMVERKQKFYDLDAIISVGYRVNSNKATQFRIWATQTLKEFIIKGFMLDDLRLKQGQTVFGKDYFKELLQRVRSIELVKEEFTSKLPMFLQNAVSIIIENPRLQKTFMLPFKTSF